MNTIIDNSLTKNIEVKYSEIDHNFALKPYSLLNFLQDIASDSAEELDFGYSYMSARDYAWFLVKYRMEFNNYPVDIQNLTLKTRPRGYNKLFAYREFEFLNNNVSLGKILSIWSVIDIKNKTTLPIATAIPNNENMIPFEKKEDDLNFGKIRPEGEITLQKEFEVRYNDLDVNGHANNGNYIIWAFEPLTLEFKTNHKIKTLDMVFKKEAKYGEKILSSVYFKDEVTTIHRIHNSQNEDLCLIECNWI